MKPKPYVNTKFSTGVRWGEEQRLRSAENHNRVRVHRKRMLAEWFPIEYVATSASPCEWLARLVETQTLDFLLESRAWTADPLDLPRMAGNGDQLATMFLEHPERLESRACPSK